MKDRLIASSFFLPFVLPVLILYLIQPDTFLLAWKGRALYVFFLWLACLEFAFSWKKLSSISFSESGYLRTFGAAVFLTIPTAYALAISQTGLNTLIIELGKLLGVPYGVKYGNWFLEYSWPLSFEYVLFSVCFLASILLMYNKEGVRKLSIALFFLSATAFFYMIDTYFPWGALWMLNLLIPFTANASAGVLTLMGYKAATQWVTSTTYGAGMVLTAFGNNSTFTAMVFWPSGGVHSIVIYTLTILLFIKGASMSMTRKAIVFVVGALGTFTANVLRIATIYTIGLRIGPGAASYFHDYYGELFFVSWLIMYLAIIAFGPGIATRISHKIRKTTPTHVDSQANTHVSI